MMWNDWVWGITPYRWSPFGDGIDGGHWNRPYYGVGTTIIMVGIIGVFGDNQMNNPMLGNTEVGLILFV